MSTGEPLPDPLFFKEKKITDVKKDLPGIGDGNSACPSDLPKPGTGAITGADSAG